MSREDDEWQRRATASAIEAARNVVGNGLNGRAMVSSLSDIEWGWIAAAAIFAWIKTRAEQAVAAGRGYDEIVRSMPGNPGPWDAGAVASILPALGGLEGVDWGKPVGDWSKDQIIGFAWQIYKLVDQAVLHRDDGATQGPGIITQQRAERINSAANGGPLMSRAELNDEVPF